MARALHCIVGPVPRNRPNSGGARTHAQAVSPNQEDMLMLENFRRKDNSRLGNTSSQSPYGRMQEALSPAPPAPETPKYPLPKSDMQKLEMQRPDIPRADMPRPEMPRPDMPRPDMPKAESPRTDLAQSVKPANKAEESVSKLIVGPDIKLKGAEITDCDTLVVEGRVEAAMESRVLQIAEIGVFDGKAAVETAEIRGRFDGELTVRKQLVIRATGHVSGKIRYGKLSIEEGGELSGDIGAIGSAPASPDKNAALAARAGTPPH